MACKTRYIFCVQKADNLQQPTDNITGGEKECQHLTS